MAGARVDFTEVSPSQGKVGTVTPNSNLLVSVPPSGPNNHNILVSFNMSNLY